MQHLDKKWGKRSGPSPWTWREKWNGAEWTQRGKGRRGDGEIIIVVMTFSSVQLRGGGGGDRDLFSGSLPQKRLPPGLA